MVQAQEREAGQTESLDGFIHRHIGPRKQEIEEMLVTVGLQTIEQLISQAVPDSIRQGEPLDLGPVLTEAEALAHMHELASQNQIYTSLIGMGYYGTLLPAVIQRNILENPGWYTAYTPYQPEISQGRLEALLNYQTLIGDLTGLPVANASLLDEATAAAEAMALAKRAGSSKSTQFFVDRAAHPQTLAVLKTRAEPLGWTLLIGNPRVDLKGADVFGALFQYPGTFGEVGDFREAVQAAQSQGALVAFAADPLALTLLTPPGELGADIAIGSTQRFGVPIGYGGPHAAYIAVRDVYKRALPGRLVGVSIDSHGSPAYRLALQTREQHIRREKATSNICTAQVLLAVVASMYAVWHGSEGLTAIATAIHRKTVTLAAGLRRLGFEILNDHFFDTITIITGNRQGEIVARARAARLNFRVLSPGECGSEAAIGVSLDETSTEAVVESVWRAFGGSMAYADVSAPDAIPAPLVRRTAFLGHPVFQRYRSETELMRYIRKLSDRDLALDRAMIPLGSCTMKLNAAAELMPITWPEFGALHPFAPKEQAAGYHLMFEELQDKLCRITGYDAISLQPNSGAQGEYAGLLAIRAYHRSRNEATRNVCLIPSSAHGTNPASAQMAGMEVVIVECDTEGNVDLEDLEAKASRHGNCLAAAMVTYPSTHGVFEAGIRELCAIVHRYGGQVYVDGANLNAQVGLVRPGDYGADVSHLNLHKTFCIPHGGGGPGMGPIGVKAHLVPFLPGHPMLNGSHLQGPVSAAPFGSASILPIPYMYLRMTGGEGQRLATEVAILSANYIATRLKGHFPVLFKNDKGRVAHECVIDARQLKDSCGVTVEDIAKRLIDYGFHAPTMSFPVQGTLMIEPTESESKAELDRFCDAMIAIRTEIREVEGGRFHIEDSPLRHAPHTVLDLLQDPWKRLYSRTEGVLPGGTSALDKYWAPVGRVDNPHGDRNLICSCPPVRN